MKRDFCLGIEKLDNKVLLSSNPWYVDAIKAPFAWNSVNTSLSKPVVAVDRSHRGKGYGRMMVNHCLERAQAKHCYKVKLCCSDKNVSFYRKLGFVTSSNGMETIL